MAVRPEPPDNPSVKLVEQLPDMGLPVVVAPATYDRIDLVDKLFGGQRRFSSCPLPDLVLKMVDRFLSWIDVQRTLLGAASDLVRRQLKWPRAALDLVA